MKIKYLLFLIAVFMMSSAYGQTTIWFLTDANGNDGDQITWLEAQGFTVFADTETMQVGLHNASQGKLDSLHNADLIIVGRAVSSGLFAGTDKLYFNAIKAPILMGSPFPARNFRANWFNTGGQYRQNATDYVAVANVLEPTDPIFTGITLTDGTFDIYTGPFTTIEGIIVDVPSNGIHLAECDGRPLITRFEPLIEFYPDAGDYPSGYCTYFGFGNDQTGVYNFFPHTDDGKTVYLAEINRMIALGDAPPSTESRMSSITTSEGVLSPAFDPDINGYSIVVPEGTESVILNGNTMDFHASATVPDTIKTLPTTAVITVTADDGTTSDYTLEISIEYPEVTFDISLENITDQEIGSDVWAIFGDNDSSIVMTDPDGDNIYAGIESFPPGTLVSYRFAYQNGPDPVTNKVIETVPMACAGSSNYREYTVPDSSTRILPIMFFGTCDDAVVKGNITFQVDMNEVSDRVADGQVWLVIGDWGELINMTDFDGDGIFSKLKSFDAGTELKYFFAYQNGDNPATDRVAEVIPELCSDINGYRYLTVPEGNMELDAYSFGKCVALTKKPTIFFIAAGTTDDDQLNNLINDPEIDVIIDRDNLSNTTIANLDAVAQQEAIDAMEGADVVVIGRGVWSSNFQEDPDVAIWHSITTPILVVSPYLVRNTRLNWFNTSELRNLNDGPEILEATALLPQDSVFDNVTMTTTNKFGYSTAPHDVLMYSINTQTNGTLMAVGGDSIMLYARFSPTVEFYNGAGEYPTGFRSYFGFGNDKLQDEFGATWYNYFDGLTDDAKTIYRAEIMRLVKLGRMQLLSAIISDVGALSPSFNPSVTEYTLVLPPGTTTVTVNGTPLDFTSTVSGGGTISASEQITLAVTGKDGSSTDYTISTRIASTDASLSDLSADEGVLDPTFDSGTFEYDLAVPEGTTYVYVSATANDPNAFVYGAGAVDVSAGDATVNVLVTAEDGISTLGYTVNISILSAIENLTSGALGFYPNPASHHVYLKDHVSADIQIYSTSGALLLEEQNVSSIDIETLVSGSYILKVVSDTAVRTGKLIIE